MRKHVENIELERKKLEDMKVLEKAAAIYKEKVWSEARAIVKGATLAPAAASRAKVLHDLFALSIPVARLDDQRLVDLIEKPHEDLGGRSGVRDQFPVVKTLLMEGTRATLRDRPVSIFFDASKVNVLVEAAMCRFLNDDLMPTQLCFGVSSVPKSMNADSLRALLRQHLNEAGIEMRNVVCAISDSGPPNPTAMKDWNKGGRDVLGRAAGERTAFLDSVLNACHVQLWYWVTQALATGETVYVWLQAYD